MYKIKIPDNTKIKINNTAIKISGPYGTIIKQKSNNIQLFLKDNFLVILESNNINEVNSLKNIIVGVSQGYSKKLKIIGVEFKVNIINNQLILRLGFSHEVIFNIPNNIKIYNPKPNLLIVIGYNNQIVSQIASEIRNLKLPEPYKGKGIRYFDEVFKQKEGKKT